MSISTMYKRAQQFLPKFQKFPSLKKKHLDPWVFSGTCYFVKKSPFKSLVNLAAPHLGDRN